MPMSSRVSGRYSTRATLSVWTSVAMLLSLSAALATWKGSPVVGALPVLGCALTVGVFTVVRRVLRRASAHIDTILREELDPERAESKDKMR